MPGLFGELLLKNYSHSFLAVMEKKQQGRKCYMLVERLHNRRISLSRYEDNGSYFLEFVTCLSKEEASEYIERKKASGLPDDLVHGRLMLTQLLLSPEAMRAVSQLSYLHEKYAEERRQLKNRRQQAAIEKRVADMDFVGSNDAIQ